MLYSRAMKRVRATAMALVLAVVVLAVAAWLWDSGPDSTAVQLRTVSVEQLEAAGLHLERANEAVVPVTRERALLALAEPQRGEVRESAVAVVRWGQGLPQECVCWVFAFDSAPASQGPIRRDMKEGPGWTLQLVDARTGEYVAGVAGSRLVPRGPGEPLGPDWDATAAP